ncbi:hypothetical protein NDU88_003043 [Pleurodeles waltl]|uniref:Uncharacterized protein n=1 Tax=Pleurodeles waltl TaxID=8319 RepID=A0AAV7TNK9_PLEWA|nr:hypothetical protein NDU88_003043 [Pleurodeles waltl]
MLLEWRAGCTSGPLKRGPAEHVAQQVGHSLQRAVAQLPTLGGLVPSPLVNWLSEAGDSGAAHQLPYRQRCMAICYNPWADGDLEHLCGPGRIPKRNTVIKMGGGAVPQKEPWPIQTSHVECEKLKRCLKSTGCLCSLKRELAQLEQEHMHGTDSQTLGRIHAKLAEFRDTALAEIQHLGRYATAHSYWEGERPGSVLANVIHPNRERSMIIAVQAEDGSEIREPELIATRFRDYYESLYTSRVALDLEELMDYCCVMEFLTYVHMPRILHSGERRLAEREDARRRWARECFCAALLPNLC